MTPTCAPAQLPFSPRPIPAELFSSWLLRVAAANCITLGELLDALESRYPGATCSKSLDLSLPHLFLQSLAEFCRVPVDRLHGLDLSKRLPHLDWALLLRFNERFDWSQRKKLQRLGYAFCPLCLAEQRVIHVLWEWCFACVTRCAIHRTPLQTGCPNCGESDPLTFGASQGKPNPACWSCGDDLSHCTSPNNICADEPTLRVVEDAYRAALLGVSSNLSLLGKVSHRNFRKFVDDMLQLLVSYADPKVISHETPPGIAMHQHRAQLFILIADLISNAAPSSDVRRRRFRQSRSLKLWTTLLALIPDFAGTDLEKASQLWPVPLRRRFNSALRIRKQRRWPYTPFRRQTLCLGFKCMDPKFVLDLSAVKSPSAAKSAI